MENIIKGGVARCFVFQTTVLVSGIFLLILGPFGLEALWRNWVILVKTLILFALMGLLTYVHLKVQPQIEALIAPLSADSPPPEGLTERLKPFRLRRKKLATFCLFLVITAIILGLQVYGAFHPVLNLGLIALAAFFARRANKTAVRFGWF